MIQDKPHREIDILQHVYRETLAESARLVLARCFDVLQYESSILNLRDHIQSCSVARCV